LFSGTSRRRSGSNEEVIIIDENTVVKAPQLEPGILDISRDENNLIPSTHFDWPQEFFRDDLVLDLGRAPSTNSNDVTTTSAFVANPDLGGVLLELFNDSYNLWS
jgi:hypothetical protein